ncbi:30S ribosomal protein S18 [Candidatus Gottesmanbacteria bacterium]|nr:30S ribosomal protein S18 [Candidatus Gottesmanbacteria bacterium]
MQRKNRFQKRERPVAKNCPFCKGKTDPDYKDSGALSRYMSERGKILGMSRTGICSKHQRAVTHAIKLARHVALLPFVVRA